MNKKNGIILHACPRCQGDLFPDIYEEDFACLQCGRRFAPAQVLQVRELTTAGKVLSAAA